MSVEAGQPYKEWLVQPTTAPALGPERWSIEPTITGTVEHGCVSFAGSVSLALWRWFARGARQRTGPARHIRPARRCPGTGSMVHRPGPGRPGAVPARGRLSGT